MPKPKILILEDTPKIQEVYKLLMETRAELLQAFTVEEAYALYKQHPTVDAIVVDGVIDGEERGPMFVRHIRKTYKGPMVAASSTLNAELMRAGCTIAAGSKVSVPIALSQVLKGF
jgi:CheY-like chemotaxis protein